MIRLFDVQNGKVIPTEHCYTLRFLKELMDTFPDDYLKMYTYIFYMTCPNPELNPFFHLRDDEKEEIIYREVDGEFSLDEPLLDEAIAVCRKLYETETSRAYQGIKRALDNMATYMANTSITDGRDGNIAQIARVAKDFDAIRQSFKGTFKDLLEEQQATVRGGQRLAYDA